jgi:polyhydroxyalkanoate synthesis regulator phasin
LRAVKVKKQQIMAHLKEAAVVVDCPNCHALRAEVEALKRRIAATQPRRCRQAPAADEDVE